MGRFVVTTLVGLASVATSAAEPLAKKPTPEELEFFESKVRPVLAEKCVTCHGPKKQMAGLRLDTAEGVKTGSDSGPVILPADPANSPFLKAIRRESDSPMPPNEPLPADIVAVLAEWVKIGAPFPDDTQTRIDPMAAAKSHWAFQPIRRPAVPLTNILPATTNPIDHFIAAKLEEKGLSFSPPADRQTLIRRAYFDLIGLPPSADAVMQFVNDPSPDAFARVVDELLASPHYGERWGRYWLDVARYSDTKGYVFQEERAFPYAYTFRDYVIRSLNEDKPYDRFLIEQLAADKLDLGDDKRPLAGMAFLTLGRRFLNNQHDIIDDRMDVVTRGMMGLTVACARCHDHKYDPIPSADYYSLYGIFASSSEPQELPVIGEGEQSKEAKAFEAEIARRQKALDDFVEDRKTGRIAGIMAITGTLAAPEQNSHRLLNRADRNEITNRQQRIDRIKATSPYAAPRAMVLQDNPRPFDPYVFLRGNPGNRGPNVPRQMPEVVAGPNRQPFTDGSGRLEFAKAVASPDNPLTARVIVNRVWLYHFGKGLVTTPSDFGTRADPPSHPELLDWLASEFMNPTNPGHENPWAVSGPPWTLKRLHRLIMLSATYQQASTRRPELDKVDPENRLLGRMNRQRLDFEALRDAMIAAAGHLDPTIGGRSVDLFKAPFTKRRSVYGFIDRQNLPSTLRAFDFASPDQHSPQRFQTTVPQQALFLMNNTFVIEQAKALASRPEFTQAQSTEERVQALYRAALSRSATAEEVALAEDFVKSAAWSMTSSRLSPWEQYVQVLLASNEFAFVD
jgi:hypothetical protein